MRLLSKVVWSEGMYLSPQHFQAQNSYFEDLIQFVASGLWFEPYGFVAYHLDPEALTNGTVSLVHARGFFPDGLAFHMPEFDALPEPINITESFSPIAQSLNVALAVPARKSRGMNCAVSDAAANHHVRYTAVEHLLCDEITGGDERKVRLGQKNIRFHLETEETPEDLVTLPMARITRDGAGHYIYDPAFIPPCLRIDASERLMSITRRLVDILEEKSSALARQSRAPGGLGAGFSATEIAHFWYRHAINSGLATLRHLCHCKRGHPEELFVEMARLGGALCTFKLDSHPSLMPLYDHRNLEACFADLDRHIRTHLEALLPTNCLQIPLKPLGNYLYAGDVVDQRCLDRARWIFAIHSPVGEVELISRTPAAVKICSSKFVPELVKRALPGLALTHLPVPPAAVARRPEFHYFGIDRSGPCWEHIVKTRQVGVYVPGELPNPEIELSVVLEG
jgi:type VI secretion system protein ImpJ